MRPLHRSRSPARSPSQRHQGRFRQRPASAARVPTATWHRMQCGPDTRARPAPTAPTQRSVSAHGLRGARPGAAACYLNLLLQGSYAACTATQLNADARNAPLERPQYQHATAHHIEADPIVTTRRLLLIQRPVNKRTDIGKICNLPRPERTARSSVCPHRMPATQLPCGRPGTSSGIGCTALLTKSVSSANR